MVGLPARGKTYISRKLCRYLSFFHGAPTRVFNVGDYRRKHAGAKKTAEFFDEQNVEGKTEREACAQMAMDDLKVWLVARQDVGRVAVYDATNTTGERRAWIVSELADVVESSMKVIFVESITNDPELIESNIRDIKLRSPDYEGFEAETAVSDFMARIRLYEQVYQPLSDESLSWIKVVDCGRQVVVNRIKGHLAGKIVQFLMSLHTKPRTIYLSRHGQSAYNAVGKIGGNPVLTEHGDDYARALGEWVSANVLQEHAPEHDNYHATSLHARLWTSSLQRTIRTAGYIPHRVVEPAGWITMRPRVWRALDEIHAGVFDGMTYDEIRATSPDDFELRKADKLSYRYPRGESYLDVIQRIEPVILGLERQEDPVLIVGHQGILRILYAYLMGVPRDECTAMAIPLNTVIVLTPSTYNCAERRVRIIDDLPSSGFDAHAPSH